MMRLDDLALLCRGKIALAAVLAWRNADISTTAQAEEFIRAKPNEIVNLLNQNTHGLLYYNFITRCIDMSRVLLSEIDFNLILTVRDTKLSIKTKFEKIFKDIIKEIDKQYGILYCANEILQEELKDKKPNNLVLRIISEIRLAALEMKRICWRLLHRSVYLVTDIRVICVLVSISIVIIPVWYFFGYHRSALTLSPPSTIFEADITEFLRRYSQANQSWPARMFEAARFLFQAVLWLPSIFLLPAAALAILRQFLPAGKSPALKSFEQNLYSIGSVLQNQLPHPPNGPTVIIGRKFMAGDKYKHYGQGSQGPNSITNVYMGAWTEIEGHVDFKKLSAELEQLRAKMKATPETTVDEDQAIAAVGKAAVAAQKGDGPGTLEKLANAGEWALKVATDIGAKVAAEAIMKALGVK
ncbi:hypothetical protein [Gluconobacter cerinus]|uniref:hypothetical protein n=1 Tax=Gluconobacter cerinus TaxID=38307 RepID=UPI0039EC2810